MGGDIPLKLLKKCGFTYEKLANCINNSLSEGLFPDSLNRANIAPIHKKNNPLDKENYRPVSILPLLSKVYERAIFNQIKFFAGFVKLIVLYMFYLDYFKCGKKKLTLLVM